MRSAANATSARPTPPTPASCTASRSVRWVIPDWPRRRSSGYASAGSSGGARRSGVAGVRPRRRGGEVGAPRRVRFAAGRGQDLRDAGAALLRDRDPHVRARGRVGDALPGGAARAEGRHHKDKGGESSCYDACAAAWPPLLTNGEPQAQGAADRSLLGTTKRRDGTSQVTYNGWPLYTYVADQKPGEANGNDIDQFGAEWYALQPNGEEPED